MKKIFILLLLLPTLAFASGHPRTLFQMAGVQTAPGRLSNSVLVIIDAQREYVDGALPLKGIHKALAQAASLLARARAAGTPIVHVVHHGGGALFNPDGPYFAIAKPMRPKPGETVIEKRLPNAFAGTNLQQVLAATGRKHLIVVGFMTHMCVSSTVRAALGEAHRRYTRHVNFREGWRGYLWQGRFASFPMDERHLLACARYVELNPVRARLVQVKRVPAGTGVSYGHRYVTSGETTLGLVPLGGLPLLGRWPGWRRRRLGGRRPVKSVEIFNIPRQHVRRGRGACRRV